MKLFVFETCPFCIRVRVFAGLKGVSPEIAHVSPGQIPDELVGRIDRLTVPILVDGETIIQDSNEIIRHFDRSGEPMLSSYGTSPALEHWRASIAAPFNALCYPRMPALNVPELASEASRAFFESAMPERIGMSFADAFAQTPQFVQAVEAALLDAAPFLDQNSISMDTLATLAELQSLTMVDELRFPEQVSECFTELMTCAGMKPFAPVSAASMSEA